VAILVGSRDHRTQIWKGAIQGSFHQSLVQIGPVASEMKILKISSLFIFSNSVGGHEFFEILPRIGNNMHPLFLAHLTQMVM
jgi:hypothetical protein